MSDAVKLIFLGGQAEIGRNMFVLEHENDLIVVDCGVGFRPSSTTASTSCCPISTM